MSMLRKLLSLIVACAILQPAFAGDAAQVKSQLRGLQPGARVELELSSGEKLKGKLASAGEEGFELQSAGKGSAAARAVKYGDVRSVQVKHGMSAGKKVGIGLAIFGGVAVLVTGLVLGAIARNG